MDSPTHQSLFWISRALTPVVGTAQGSRDRGGRSRAESALHRVDSS